VNAASYDAYVSPSTIPPVDVIVGGVVSTVQS